jgi:hypothetical protein
MTDDLSRLLPAALTPNPAGQNAFAERLPSFISSFPADWVRDELIPFLVSWLPSNNRKALALVAVALKPILSALSDISVASPLVESLLAPDVSDVTTTVLKVISELSPTQTVQLIPIIAKSPYDCVRRVLGGLLVQSNDEKLILETSQAIASDPSFMVRFAFAEVIRKFDKGVAKTVATQLAKDSQARVRGFLAHDLASEPYYFEVTAGLVADFDWSVRASLASALARAADIAQAATLCTKFIADGVWQVQLCALRSLTSILSSNPSFEFTFSFPSEKLMKIAHIPLKTAAIDCFFALRGLSKDSVTGFAGLLAKEPSDVKLHFISTVSGTPFLADVIKPVTEIAFQLGKDPKWRIRLGVVSLLFPIAEKLKNPSTSTEFTTFVTRMLEDEAFPVRSEAILHLAKTFAGASEIPESVKDLAQADNFRKRQCAIGILAELHKLVDGPVKDVILGELKNLEQDPVSNVSYAAGQAIASLAA